MGADSKDSRADKKGRRGPPVLPPAALIPVPQPTTTTTTEPAAQYHATPTTDGHQTHKRSRSKEILTALASPFMAPSSFRKRDDKPLPTCREGEAHADVTTTESSEYEPFPSFESYPRRSRFSLTRSLSLKTITGTGYQRGEQERGVLRRTLTSDTGVFHTAPSSRRGSAYGSEREVTRWGAREREMGISEALGRTQICSWAGPWRKTSSGDYICPCGEHRVGEDSAWVRCLDEQRARERSSTH